uniref:structural maintenance of chromosomes flexible hinge domain-containing protein 1 n=1 Tax=Myxine glutinosa TaxID=7769 RepID=UPI00358EB05B
MDYPAYAPAANERAGVGCEMSLLPLSGSVGLQNQVSSRLSLFVFDRRNDSTKTAPFPLVIPRSYAALRKHVIQKLNIPTEEVFVLTNVERKQICDEESFVFHVTERSTICVLSDAKQQLESPTQVEVHFLPHYDTLVKSGMYEYYASEGHNPLPYALAELIDNSLAATVDNKGKREIEIRVVYDDSLSKTTVIVIDNGRGMTTKELNNWAIYRASKFVHCRKSSEAAKQAKCGKSLRSLNSNISFFGVGGKQASFHIGQCVRMITKPAASMDVHEIELSKDDFEKKEDNRKAIYTGFISSRKPGDISLVKNESAVQTLIAEEITRESFTAVVVTMLRPNHANYLKNSFYEWTRQLAHIYHYYLHGPHGNDLKKTTPNNRKNINIKVRLLKPKQDVELNLRDVSDDMQSLYISTTVDTFEFHVHPDTNSVVEGLVRYHPFLYDSESYPVDPSFSAPSEEEDDVVSVVPQNSLVKWPIFECYWNGRLIPYTTINEFPWCSPKKKHLSVPFECYKRISGVLFTDDTFLVSTNKLTFIDLEHRLKEKNLLYTRIINGQVQRMNINREFYNWLRECHQKHDKQIQFLGPSRPSGISDPAFTLFKYIIWDHQKYAVDQLVKTSRTVPIVYGSIKEIRLQGHHTTDVFAAGGEILVQQEPRMICSEMKLHPLVKLDRSASEDVIKKHIEDEMTNYDHHMARKCSSSIGIASSIALNYACGRTKDYPPATYKVRACRTVGARCCPGSRHGRVNTRSRTRVDQSRTSTPEPSARTFLPCHLPGPSPPSCYSPFVLPARLSISWPEGDSIEPNVPRPAGKPIGVMKVEILNKREESISKLPGSFNVVSKKLLVELKIVSYNLMGIGPEEVVSHVCQYGGKWQYWFKKMENMTNRGSFMLKLQAILADNTADNFPGLLLPSLDIPFTVTEAQPFKFFFGMMDTTPQVSVPFDITLDMKDKFGHDSTPLETLKPKLQAVDLDISYASTAVKRASLIVKDVIIKGSVTDLRGKDFVLKVEIPGLEKDVQTIKVRLLPGPPCSISVSPKAELLLIENGTSPHFDVCLLDVFGNATWSQRVSATCQFSGYPGLPTYSVGLSPTGPVKLTGEPLRLPLNRNTMEMMLFACIELKPNMDVPMVERKLKVTPSSLAKEMQLYWCGDTIGKRIQNGEVVSSPAGSVLTNLNYRLYDEVEREVVLTSTIVHDIQVNWAAVAGQECLLKGMLPDVAVSTSLSEEKYCEISYLNNRRPFKTSFTLRPEATEAKRLKVQYSGDLVVHLGKALPAKIEVYLVDEFGNMTARPSLPCFSQLKVSGEGLDCSMMEVVSQEEELKATVSGLRFSPGAPGPRNIMFDYNGFIETLVVSLIPGLPSSLALVDAPKDDVPLVAFNQRLLKDVFLFQLLDLWGNLCCQSGVKVTLHRPAALKLVPAPTPQRTDKSGRVKFGPFMVFGKSGDYTLQARATLGQDVLEAPPLAICVSLDPNKPIRVELTFTSEEGGFVAGEIMPEVQINVVAEDGSNMRDIPPGDVFMNSENPSLMIMKIMKCLSLRANHSQVTRKDTPMGKVLPEEAGAYTAIALYRNKNCSLHSEELSLTVCVGTPARLKPTSPTETPTVSNTHPEASRTLLTELQLHLVDKFDNRTGLTKTGKVIVKLEPPPDFPQLELPTFRGQKTKLVLPLANGVCNVPKLMLAENCPGKGSTEYIVTFTAQSNLLNVEPAPSFSLPFVFYNDFKKQLKMAELSKKRDGLQNNIRLYGNLLQSNDTLIMDLKERMDKVLQEEKSLARNLERFGITQDDVNATRADDLLKQLYKRKEMVFMQPRRMCEMAQFPKLDDEILGKAAHMALIREADVALVLSWHMSSDMDCVVTRTSEAAMKIYKATQGRQQVLPLESIFQLSLPNWNKPLPHIRNNEPLFNPTGNPVYARNLLMFPSHENECRLVFGLFLGDTIILDTLDSANAYRQEVVKRCYCPALLTRSGDRIRSNGKFGGFQNKAPPLERLGGAHFGEPLPPEYHELCPRIDLLQALVDIRKKGDAVQREYHLQEEDSRAHGIDQIRDEMKIFEKELLSIEKELGLRKTPNQPSQHSGATPASNGQRRGRSLSSVHNSPIIKKRRH